MYILEFSSKCFSFEMTHVCPTKHFHNQGIACVGTVHANCLPNPKIRHDVVIRKKDEGTSELRITKNDDAELTAIKFLHNHVVFFFPYMSW